jgi:hypothetical protein
MRPEDTITAYCPESVCSIKEWMIQNTNGVCGGDERSWKPDDAGLNFIGNFSCSALNFYCVTINIINKTQKNMACYCSTTSYDDNGGLVSATKFIPANSSKKIGVQGQEIAGSKRGGRAPFKIYTCKDEASFGNIIDNIAQFEIWYDNSCSFNSYNLSYSITNTINIKDSIKSLFPTPCLFFGSPPLYHCGVDIVYYPTSFLPGLPIIPLPISTKDGHNTRDLINGSGIYRKNQKES